MLWARRNAGRNRKRKSMLEKTIIQGSAFKECVFGAGGSERESIIYDLAVSPPIQFSSEKAPRMVSNLLIDDNT
jgi:hypothetical protein